MLEEGESAKKRLIGEFRWGGLIKMRSMCIHRAHLVVVGVDICIVRMLLLSD